MTRRPAVGHVSTGVVVIGAGPVGLLLACELRRALVPVIIVERLASPMTESRASLLTSLTAELLHERGFDSLLKETAPEPRAHFGGLPLELSGLDSQYAGNWKLPQFRTEAIFAERAEELGATLLRDHELAQIAELDDHITCTVRGPAGELRIRAEYVAGCDGGASTVRRICGFSSTTSGPTRQMLRADVTGIQIPDRRFERLPGGLAVAGTRDGVTRVMVCPSGQPVTERREPPRFPEVVGVWKQVTGEDISAGNATWIDSFDNSTGQADSYRRGRVLLAGDAAHWHMPVGGQALNVGLQDAINLGWKLAGSVNGWAPPRLLDTYHDERHPVAARVIKYVTAQEIILFGGLDIEPLRKVLGEITRLGQARDHLARVVSNLDDRYGPPDSPLVGRRIGNLRVRNGSGAPVTVGSLAGTTPAIVRLAPAVTEKAFPVPTIHAAPDDGSYSSITTVLMRPDGYVAWAGDDDGELELAIGQWFSASNPVRYEGNGKV